MNAAADWFPSSKTLLCLWHVNKAVLQRCRPAFTAKSGRASYPTGEGGWEEFYAAWHALVASPNEQIFDDRLVKFELKYGEKHPESVGYVKTFWLEPYKEMIVKAWVDGHPHFGNVATSR
jgi:hypothetical protein